jgi:hypothetical protein
MPLYLAGARLLEVFPVLPVMGNLTLVVGVLSYAGQLNLTAVADPDGCPDVEVFAQRCARPSTTSRRQRIEIRPTVSSGRRGRGKE